MRANGNASVLMLFLLFIFVISNHCLIVCLFRDPHNNFEVYGIPTFPYHYETALHEQKCGLRLIDWSFIIRRMFWQYVSMRDGGCYNVNVLWLPWQSNNHPWIYCCHTHWYTDRCGYQHGDIMTQTRFPFYRSFVVNLALWDLMKGIQNSVVKAITTCLGVTAASQNTGQEINSPESKD